MKKNKTILLTALMASFTGLSAHAATLVTPSSIVFNDLLVRQGFPPMQTVGPAGIADLSSTATALINGSGLSATPTINNYLTVTHASPTFGAGGNAWTSIDPGQPGGDFFADVQTMGTPFANGPGGTFTFEFSSPEDLTDMVAWNYNFASRGVNGSNVQTYDFFFEMGVGPTVNLTGISRTVESAQGFGPGVFNFGSTITGVTRVTATPQDNMFGSTFSGGSAIGGDRYGLTEVRFLAVPEPSAALLGALAGLIGLGRRRRAQS